MEESEEEGADSDSPDRKKRKKDRKEKDEKKSKKHHKSSHHRKKMVLLTLTPRKTVLIKSIKKVKSQKEEIQSLKMTAVINTYQKDIKNIKEMVKIPLIMQWMMLTL